ncbi:ADP-ribosyltransferase [Siphonobacter sp. SORGH_AS_1065]|uniref:ADP-ribosyltransferase n=1 Tax=Siphonobacter sp. SORGH_AS_1065 TaxID=3041795 RepID=UPI002788E50E|nr:ADP-ribosyltransferase [Siphonobacter sp. SORGH_AS_1065]MDQ1090022.1 hypothetical protein [Siphonobacter sp. SORGH_AS_1065]
MSLSPEELSAIYEYTKERYRDLNYPLNSGTEVSASIQAGINLLNQALSKLPPIEGEFYRSIAIPQEDLIGYISYLKQNRLLTFPAFTSTSRSKGVALKFGGNVMFIISSRLGRHIKELAHYPQEDEVLFRAPSSFIVMKISPRKFNGQIIGLEVYLNDA